MSELRCDTGGEASFTLPRIFHDGTPLACATCGTGICSWGELKARLRALEAEQRPTASREPERSPAATRH